MLVFSFLINTVCGDGFAFECQTNIVFDKQRPDDYYLEASIFF